MATATTKTPPAEAPPEETPVSVQAVEMMKARVEQLRPLADEYSTLTQMLSRLDGAAPQASPAPSPPARQQSTPSAANGESGTRKDEVLAVIRSTPGLSVSQIGDKLGVQQKNYLYRVTGQLASDGLIRKEGRGYVPVS